MFKYERYRICYCYQCLYFTWSLLKLVDGSVHCSIFGHHICFRYYYHIWTQWFLRCLYTTALFRFLSKKATFLLYNHTHIFINLQGFNVLYFTSVMHLENIHTIYTTEDKVFDAHRVAFTFLFVYSFVVKIQYYLPSCRPCF